MILQPYLSVAAVLRKQGWLYCPWLSGLGIWGNSQPFTQPDRFRSSRNQLNIWSKLKAMLIHTAPKIWRNFDFLNLKVEWMLPISFSLVFIWIFSTRNRHPRFTTSIGVPGLTLSTCLQTYQYLNPSQQHQECRCSRSGPKLLYFSVFEPAIQICSETKTVLVKHRTGYKKVYTCTVPGLLASKI